MCVLKWLMRAVPPPSVLPRNAIRCVLLAGIVIIIFVVVATVMRMRHTFRCLSIVIDLDIELVIVTYM